MPYAPGVQDISGQLIAQGMSQAGAARARAIESIGESIAGGIKQYQQNQMFTNQALGKFGMGLQDPTFKQYVQQVVNDDPNAPQVPDALKKAFKNAQAGKVDIYDAALLGTAAEGYAQNKMRAAQVQGMISEDALRKAQADKLQIEAQRMREENAFFKNLEEQTTREQQAPAFPPVLQPTAQAVAPAQIPHFLRRDVAGQVAPSAAPQEAIAAMAAPAAAMAQGRPSSAITSQDIFEARRQLGPGANVAQIRMMAQKNVEARAKEFRPEGLYGTRTEARTASKQLDQNDPVQGFVRTEEYDPQAKAFVIKLVQKPETPESKIAVAGGQEAVKARVTTASANLAKVRTGAMQARDDLPRLDRMQEALEAGVRTGFMAPEIAGLTSALVEIGLYPEGKQAKIEQLIADAGVDALQKARYYMDNQGSVSEGERKRVDVISQNARTNPKALLEMVKISRAYALRQDAADNYRRNLLQKFENDPMREVRINDMMDEWWADNSIRKFEKSGSLGGQTRQSADDIFNEVMGGKK